MRTTRDNILDGYDIRAGIIRSPGKFEGERVYTPYYWGFVLDGGGETIYDNDTAVEKFTVDKTDRELFPELVEDRAETVYIWENDVGFVYCAVNGGLGNEIDESLAQ
jgi:hypothetical protein|tara:strand:- start:3713 stop:4033 length:321 start_codon:yes stop_codon:yes gene_type:complete